MGKKGDSERFMSSVKVGAKGQIVIPKEVREMFGINPGDTMMILADSKKGIALERYGVMAKIADAIFSGKAHEIYPDQPEEYSMRFAGVIRELEDADDEEDEGGVNQ